MIKMAKVNIFLSLNWFYSFCLLASTMESNLAIVDLSDFSHSLLMCSIKSLEIFLVLEFLCTSLGCTVRVFAAGI